MNILIVEDEPKTAKLLKELVEAHDKANTVVGICDSIEGTVGRVRTGAQVDLFFMDIMLADGNSFEIFKQVKVTAPVIFCTAYDNHLMAAFKHNGVDYILKPFREEDIENAFAKIKQLKQALVINGEAAGLLAKMLKPATQQNAFLIQFREKIYPVEVRDIALVALENEVVYLYTFNGQKHPLFKPLDEIENALNPSKFFRINRQMLVSRDAVVAVEPFYNRKACVKLKVATAEKPVVSRLKVSAFLNWVERG